ncbi:MAG: N-acetylglucosamine repressor [Phycisphaerae bacterium]|nr:N-acetylglucosamine repressor [Phycisphaerae bacterium]
MYVHPAELRHANTRRLFCQLLSAGPASRAALSRATGLSAVTVGRVIDSLCENGIAEEFEAPAHGTAPAMGRPPRWVRLSDRPQFLAVELGMRSTRVAALPFARPAGSEPCVQFATPKSRRLFVAAVRAARDRLGLRRPRAALLSVPGVLNEQSGTILFSPNLHWTEGPELVPELTARCACEALAVQEIQALALGHQAAEPAAESFLLIDFGDGVGGAVVTRGRLMEGPAPLSGEIGHTLVPGNSRPCGCGATGCLETIASRTGLLATFRTGGFPRATWQAMAAHIARQGIEPWLAAAIEAAGVIIAGATNLLGIGEIVVTGDLPALHPDVTPKLEESIRGHALLGRFGRLSCRAAPRRRMLGLVVAASHRVGLPEPSMVALPEERAV